MSCHRIPSLLTGLSCWLILPMALIMLLTGDLPAPASIIGVGPFARQTVQILYDGAGVPHVVASSPAGVYWGFGYSLGRSRLFQMELQRRAVQGRLAEVFGPEFIDADLLARRDRVSPAELVEGLARAPAPFREALTAFTAGLNAAVRAVQTRRLPLEAGFTAAGIAPSSFTEIDLLEIFAGTMAVRFNDSTQELDNLHLLRYLTEKYGPRRAAAIFDEVVPAQAVATTAMMAGTWEDGSPVASPSWMGAAVGRFSGDFPDSPSPVLRSRHRDELLRRLGLPDRSGSYAVALSAKALGGKGAVLYGGPQMGVFKPPALFEVGLHCPEFDLVGTTPVGYLVLPFGATRHLAFTATAGVGNQVDLLALNVDPADPSILRGDGVTVLLRRRQEAIAVRGRPRPVVHQIEETDLGPIIAAEGPVRYVKQRGWQGRVVDSYVAWFDSNRATTLAAWVETSDRLALSINWLAVDRSGAMACVHTGVTKGRRAAGDDRLPVTRPTEFTYPDRRLAAFDHPEGWFVNWNCPPILGFRNGDLVNAWGPDQRTAFLVDQLRKHRNHLSAEFCRDLEQAVATTDQRAFAYREELARWIDVASLTIAQQQAWVAMARWNARRLDLNGDGLFDDPGAGLFDRFWNDLHRRVLEPTLGSFTWMVASDHTCTRSSLLLRALRRTTAFDFLGGRSPREVVTETFREAVEALAPGGRPLPRLPCPRMEFAAAIPGGASTQTGPAAFPMFMNRGSDVQIAALDPKGVRVWGILPPGNDAAGPHAIDQIGPFRAYQFRDRPLTLEQLSRKVHRKVILLPWRPQ